MAGRRMGILYRQVIVNRMVSKSCGTSAIGFPEGFGFSVPTDGEMTECIEIGSRLATVSRIWARLLRKRSSCRELSSEPEEVSSSSDEVASASDAESIESRSPWVSNGSDVPSSRELAKTLLALANF